MSNSNLIVTTSNEVQGQRIAQYLGVVRGVVVRAPGLSQRFSGAFAAFSGGNIREFEEVCEQARAHAYDRMLGHAGQLGADAIVAMRYDATDFSESITEVMAYGTAVKLAPLAEVRAAEAGRE